MNSTDPTTPRSETLTLDVDRTDRLRTFLVVEAAADLAQAHAYQPGRGKALRRVAIGGMAAAMLVGAMIALDAGTTSKANRADAAVSITQEDGWTTLKLNDPQASASEVLAELHAAGISAKTAPEGSDPWADEPTPGDEPTNSGEELVTSGGAVGTFTEAGMTRQAGGQVDAGAIVEIQVEFTEPEGVSSPGAGEPEGVDEPVSETAERDYERAIGVRTDQEAQTVSIRNGEDHPVILFVAD